MMGNLKKNLGYQLIYRIIIVGTPLIVTPYLARTLGADKLGIHSYTQSIVAYFTLFAMLGFAKYGQRNIATNASNIEKRSKIFWSIYLLQLFTSILAILLYSIYIIWICDENIKIATIQMLDIFACMLDISWLYFGVEDFKFTTIRSTLIKLLSVILIFFLVKDQKDLWIYVMIMSGSLVLNQLILWSRITKIVNKCKITFHDIVMHVKPVLVLFMPILAISIYHIMDKTMLGAITGGKNGFAQSGYYANADKVINIPMEIFFGIATVFMPRICALIGQNKKQKADTLFCQSTELMLILASGMAFGVAAVSSDFVPIFFGNDYAPCVSLIIAFSPVLFINAVAIAIRYQYLIPNQYDSTYALATICGLVVNLVLNTFLIPQYAAMGAVIGTVCAELVTCLVQMSSLIGKISIKEIAFHGLLYLTAGAIMGCSVYMLATVLSGGIMALLVEIAFGIIVYVALILIFVYLFNIRVVLRILKGRKNEYF